MASIDKEDMDDDVSPTTTTTNLQDGSILNSNTCPNGPPVGLFFALPLFGALQRRLGINE